MAKPLIIVESPAKARTIAGFLGDGYAVASSVGHIRDLPRNASEVPARVRNESWGRLGVNVEEGFEPVYVVPKERRDTIRTLKNMLADASELYLATDEDREGESIAWHLVEVLKPKVPVRRMVFHEITRAAIEEALANPRDLDRQLVDAQEARRILDRLYGYEVSPVLWRRVKPRLSAGRVQSVAVRIIVERERQRMAFRSASYWDLEGEFATASDDIFKATLATIGGDRVATGKDFSSTGEHTKGDTVVLGEAGARQLAQAIAEEPMAVRSVERKPYSRSPYPPFRTSTLQQEGGRKLRFSAARTMSAAQRLYENGYITYMRTDSTSLSEAAVAAARQTARELYGDRYVPAKPRVYRQKVKGAQEAHEAIRPAGDRFRTPDEVERELEADQAKIYDLIWRRTVASQMQNTKGERVQVRLAGTATDGRDVEFAAGGKIISFVGFLKAYVEDSDDPDADRDDEERRLPALAEGEAVKTRSVEPKGHDTKPPARFTEASLVRRLEELGVGRPSTYASILSTIQDRGYVWKKGSALIPTFTAFATVTLLERFFGKLVDYAFTARMESDLDRIAEGEEETAPWLSRFYFGEDGLKQLVEQNLDEIDPREINSIPIGTDSSGRDVVVRVGKYGPYLQRGEDRASIPEDLPPDELTVDASTELLDAPSGDKILGTDPDSGLTVFARTGRYGPYVQLGDDEEVDGKPKRASLFRSMTTDELGLEDAMKLLSLPREVGVDAEGEPIIVQNGRYGPFLKRGKDTRSLTTEDELFTVTLDEALRLLEEPPRRGRRSNSPLKEFGDDPSSGKKVVLRTGRYGPYVTDGETNASLRKTDDPDSITEERAFELLRLKREKA